MTEAVSVVQPPAPEHRSCIWGWAYRAACTPVPTPAYTPRPSGLHPGRTGGRPLCCTPWAYGAVRRTMLYARRVVLCADACAAAAPRRCQSRFASKAAASLHVATAGAAVKNRGEPDPGFFRNHPPPQTKCAHAGAGARCPEFDVENIKECAFRRGKEREKRIRIQIFEIWREIGGKETEKIWSLFYEIESDLIAPPHPFGWFNRW